MWCLPLGSLSLMTEFRIGLLLGISTRTVARWPTLFYNSRIIKQKQINLGLAIALQPYVTLALRRRVQICRACISNLRLELRRNYRLQVSWLVMWLATLVLSCVDLTWLGSRQLWVCVSVCVCVCVCVYDLAYNVVAFWASSLFGRKWGLNFAKPTGELERRRRRRRNKSKREIYLSFFRSVSRDFKYKQAHNELARIDWIESEMNATFPLAARNVLDTGTVAKVAAFCNPLRRQRSRLRSLAWILFGARMISKKKSQLT